jgi:hypothetical protein
VHWPTQTWRSNLICRSQLLYVLIVTIIFAQWNPVFHMFLLWHDFHVLLTNKDWDINFILRVKWALNQTFFCKTQLTSTNLPRHFESFFVWVPIFINTFTATVRIQYLRNLKIQDHIVLHIWRWNFLKDMASKWDVLL